LPAAVSDFRCPRHILPNLAANASEVDLTPGGWRNIIYGQFVIQHQSVAHGWVGSGSGGRVSNAQIETSWQQTYVYLV